MASLQTLPFLRRRAYLRPHCGCPRPGRCGLHGSIFWQNFSYYSTDAQQDYMFRNYHNSAKRAYLFHDIYNDMALHAVRPLAYIFSFLTTGLLKRSFLQDSVYFVDEMKSSGIVPNVNSNFEHIPDFAIVSNTLTTPYNNNDRQTMVASKKAEGKSPLNVPNLVHTGLLNTCRFRDKRDASHWVVIVERMERPRIQSAAFHSSSHWSARTSDDKDIESSMSKSGEVWEECGVGIEHDDLEEEIIEGDAYEATSDSEGKGRKMKQRGKEDNKKGRRVNTEITSSHVRLVTDKGHKLMSRHQALKLAKEMKLDLVEVDGKSSPPVCKIFDVHKEQYRQEQREKDRKKKLMEKMRLNEIKELRFTSKTERKDLEMKARKACEFMDRGHRIKFVVNFSSDGLRGELFDRILPLLKDVGVVEQGPKVESQRGWVLLRHIKFGPIKKQVPKVKPEGEENEEVEEEDEDEDEDEDEEEDEEADYLFGGDSEEEVEEVEVVNVKAQHSKQGMKQVKHEGRAKESAFASSRQPWKGASSRDPKGAAASSSSSSSSSTSSNSTSTSSTSAMKTKVDNPKAFEHIRRPTQPGGFSPTKVAPPLQYNNPSPINPSPLGGPKGRGRAQGPVVPPPSQGGPPRSFGRGNFPPGYPPRAPIGFPSDDPKKNDQDQD